MNIIRCYKRWIVLVLVFACMAGILFPLCVKAESTNINRFNVVIVLDASNSMNYTDPNGFRYEAISQFTNLLTKQGNYLGGIVFSNHVAAQEGPFEINSQEDKDIVTDTLKSVMSTGVTGEMGYTNIGEALSTAVELLKTKGNEELPSVIVFLSDGNTEMPTNDEQSTSLEQKAEAILTARENNISIYSVCLNANNKADISEMRQISDATGGEFREVAKAEDLQDVFNAFYSLIYGTSAINLFDDVFPENGMLETEFYVPGIGVEEVNIIIDGVVADMELLSPDGSDADAAQVSSESYTLVKLENVVPGTWTLVTKGVSGSSIRINMVYNTNLNVGIGIELDHLTAIPGEAVKMTARLMAGDMAAVSSEQYTGYTAELKILNAYQEEIESMEMDIGDSCFEADYAFEEGAYYVKAVVSGNYLEKVSESLGPLVVSKNAYTDEKTAVNTAPEPIDTPVKKKVFLWPFKGGSIEIDLGSLAKDEQEDRLVYEIVSSSFIEGTDYTLSDNQLFMDHFSLSKGSFDIKATDTGGLSCNVELIIVTYNIGVITCILLGIGALVILAAVGLNIRWWSKKPFLGKITVNGYEITPNSKTCRGKCWLSRFQLGDVGLNMSKCYFQATGEDYIYLITDIPLKSTQLPKTETGKKTKIRARMLVTLQADKDGAKPFTVKFVSNIKQGHKGGGAPRRKAVRPVRR